MGSSGGPASPLFCSRWLPANPSLPPGWLPVLLFSRKDLTIVRVPSLNKPSTTLLLVPASGLPCTLFQDPFPSHPRIADSLGLACPSAHSVTHLAHAANLREFHYLHWLFGGKRLPGSRRRKACLSLLAPLGAVLQTDMRLGVGQSREPREKVTAAKQAGGDEGDLGHEVAQEAGGERMFPG